MPEPDRIPNKIWHKLFNIPIFLEKITILFNTSVKTRHNSRYFQTSTTVALRKAAPRDYRLPKLYRPVVLLNTLGKILELIIAIQIAWTLEKYKLFSKIYLEKRKNISTDYIIQLILDYIYCIWDRDKKISIVLLNISDVFDNVFYIRLLFNLYQFKLRYFAN